MLLKTLLVGRLLRQRDVSGQVRFELGLLGVRFLKPLHELRVALVQISISGHLTSRWVAVGQFDACLDRLPSTAVPESDQAIQRAQPQPITGRTIVLPPSATCCAARAIAFAACSPSASINRNPPM